jgi:penicillin amidase
MAKAHRRRCGVGFLAVSAAFWCAHVLAQAPTLETLSQRALATIDGVTAIRGLSREVRVVRDEWGVPHIYAQSEADLFFAQGYVMAQDRLWQMEVWRRSAEGRLAEILGPGAIARDRIARLLKYRGPVDDQELSAYHPQARRLMEAYVTGVNAFIETHRDRLPVEFVLTGIAPEPWTLETLLLRQIAFGDAAAELQLARSAAQLGAAEANKRRNPDPWDDLRVPDGLDLARFAEIGDEVIAAVRGGGGGVRPEILPQYRALVQRNAGGDDGTSVGEPGSNNWVVSGAMSATGKPVVANDPHREVTLPSLRYIVHLNAPGWNVIGASEPPFLGVAIGHNERVAWGLTIVGTDQHDVYVEELNPANPLQTKWNGGWAPIRAAREEIRIKGQAPQTIELKFTRHGPIFYEDATRHRAYVVKSALHERGTAPYLAGLRLSQTKNCRELLAEAAYWNAPSENLICGDVDGNIAWRASAWTPDRAGWTGRLPVPGTGQYEWKGSRRDLPQELNPARGFIATANHNVQPRDYRPPFMFKNADTRFDRITRLRQMLKPGTKYTIDDHKRMQHDAYSLRAASDVSSFEGWNARDPDVERARALLASWDAIFTKDSAAAAVYEAARTAAGQGGLPRRDTADERKAALEPLLRKALANLTQSQGAVHASWRWGRMHTRAFAHPFVPPFSLATVERPGGAGTVAADGASYREILDVADWDRSVVTNVPGQSGQPGSKFYGNLLPHWADNVYFPLVFSRAAVDRHAAHSLTLKPR